MTDIEMPGGRRSKRESSNRQWQATCVFLTSTVLMITWKYFGSAEFYEEHLASRIVILQDVEFTAAAYMFATSFSLLALVPALIVRFVFRRRLADYGVCWGDVKQACIALIVFGPLFLLASYLGTRDPSVREYYPVNRGAARAFGLHAILFFCFYVGWEFHFRGFLQFGLRDAVGSVNAILVQVMASTLIHIGTPANVSFMAIIAGLVWGVMAYRTRSLLAGLLLHYLLGISFDCFLLFES